MKFEEFRTKVKEALPEFLPGELSKSVIRDVNADKVQMGELRGIMIYG